MNTKMIKIKLENEEYELIENIKEGFNEEELKSKFTEYFHPYDYVVGDWAYGKLRLKGFYEEKSRNAKQINNIKNLKNYLKDNCAYNCKYFIIKRVYKNN